MLSRYLQGLLRSSAAIKVYEQIAAEAAASRTLVAQAQYRLAVCHQKNGRKDQAIKILNALLQQFPSDAALNPKARRTLAELGAAPPEAISVRQVPLPPTAIGGWMMSLSPDGRLLAHEPKDNDDLAVCEVATGKAWTVAKGTTNNSSWYEARFSPDSQWLAFEFSGVTITVVKNDGSETRKLYEGDEKKEELRLLGWSLDSKQVVVRSFDPNARATENFQVRCEYPDFPQLGNRPLPNWNPAPSEPIGAIRANDAQPKGLQLVSSGQRPGNSVNQHS